MKKKLRIAINAQIAPGTGSSSLETVLRVLTELGRLDDGNEEYTFIGHWSEGDWLEPYLNNNQKLVRAPAPLSAKLSRAELVKRALGPLRPIVRKVKQAVVSPSHSPLPASPSITNLPVSSGFYESLDCDVIHFPYQDYILCRDVPTIYNPHDLQHLHYPNFFTPEEVARREIIYPSACRAARVVVTASQFVKQDIIGNYRIEADKIQVIPWSPPPVKTKLKEFSQKEVAILLEKYNLPSPPFILYPAMTWEHKNHLRLLEAVNLLREKKNLEINVVCTGHKNAFYPRIEQRLNELGLEKQVVFPGIVSVEELSLLYHLAQFVIIPTLFEAASAPLFEAWQHGTAVACSNVTSLPEQSANGTAALLFDPFSVEEISSAIKRLATNETLRAELQVNGFKRLKDFDLSRTLRAYRAIYRKTAGAELSEEDRFLLSWDWMSDDNAQFKTKI